MVELRDARAVRRTFKITADVSIVVREGVSAEAAFARVVRWARHNIRGLSGVQLSELGVEGDGKPEEAGEGPFLVAKPAAHEHEPGVGR